MEGQSRFEGTPLSGPLDDDSHEDRQARVPKRRQLRRLTSRGKQSDDSYGDWQAGGAKVTTVTEIDNAVVEKVTTVTQICKQVAQTWRQLRRLTTQGGTGDDSYEDWQARGPKVATVTKIGKTQTGTTGRLFSNKK